MNLFFLRRVRILTAVISIFLVSLPFLDVTQQLPGGFTRLLFLFQFVPSFLGSLNGLTISMAALFFILLLTFLFGRIYCSFFCPLGILMDGIGWLRKRFYGKRTFRYQPLPPFFRYGVLVAFLLSAVSGTFFLVDMLDPFSNFGRMMTHLVRPVVTGLQNIFSGIFEFFHVYGLPPASFRGFHLPVFFFTLSFFCLIVFLTTSGGRKYCNLICPVGALLGLFSRFSLFKLKIDKDACISCRKCETVCKANCLNVRSQKIDTERCVACFNCVTICPETAMFYGRKRPTIPEESRETPQRRVFLILAGAIFFPSFLRNGFALENITITKKNKIPVNRMNPVTPPGSQGILHFTSFCISCHACVSACPSNVLAPTFVSYKGKGLFMPHLDNTFGFCNYKCTVCGEVCPTGAILPQSIEKKKSIQIGRVNFIRDNCVVVLQGTECGACAEHCPTKAVSMAREGKVRIPKIDPDICVGCGACEHICPAKPHKAIYVEGNVIHEKALPPKPVKSMKESVVEEFPF